MANETDPTAPAELQTLDRDRQAFYDDLISRKQISSSEARRLAITYLILELRGVDIFDRIVGADVSREKRVLAKILSRLAVGDFTILRDNIAIQATYVIFEKMRLGLSQLSRIRELIKSISH